MFFEIWLTTGLIGWGLGVVYMTMEDRHARDPIVWFGASVIMLPLCLVAGPLVLILFATALAQVVRD